MFVNQARTCFCHQGITFIVVSKFPYNLYNYSMAAPAEATYSLTRNRYRRIINRTNVGKFAIDFSILQSIVG
jgi:hypothetical protein